MPTRAYGRILLPIRRLVALALSLALATGCAKSLRRSLVPPDSVSALDKKSAYLKAHLRDGRVYVLSPWTVDESARTVSGEGELRDTDRAVVAKGSQTFSIDDVALFET